MKTTGIIRRIIKNGRHTAMTLLLVMTALTAAWAQVDVPLTLEAIDDGTITVENPKEGMQYSINGGTKTVMTTTTEIPITAGQKVQFYGNETSIKLYNGTHIGGSAECYIYGNIMSLVDENNFPTATTLTETDTFRNLFSENYSLNNHPTNKLVLPATKLANNCYEAMFMDCADLTEAPELPATTLTRDCYKFMFEGCIGLTEAPELPATTLDMGCYTNMFLKCTGLTKAPELPATTLAPNCYESMFHGCTNLNYVKCLATDISARDCTLDWLKDVAASGTFEKAVKSEWDIGSIGIPDGWTVKSCTPGPALTLEAIANGTITVVRPQESMQYSIDGGTKTEMTTGNTQIQVNAGQKVQFYGKGKSITSYSGTRFQCNADCYIYGNVMSLVDENDFEYNMTLTANNTFAELFSANMYLKNHQEKPLLLPATTLTKNCYKGMFDGCTGLTEAPELPATTLKQGCYAGMFQNCSNISSAPELLAPTLAKNCYKEMFKYCNNLNYVKCLATDISADDCTTLWLRGVASQGIFLKAVKTEWSTGTSGIPSGWTPKPYTLAPALTLEAIADGTITVYSPKKNMQYSINGGTKTAMTTTNTQIKVKAGQKVQFYGNETNITSYYDTRIQCSADCYIYGNVMSLVDENDFEYNLTLPANNTFNALFYGNAHLKNHPDKPLVLPATTLKQDCYFNMFYGCKGLTVAPELPATTLAPSCYRSMFESCTNLNYVRCLATDISASGCTLNWLNNVAASGLFVKAAGMEGWTRGNNGIPEGWTVVGPNGITLYDTGDNSATLDAKDGQTFDYVLLAGRTLYRDGTWNTLCLPFNVGDGDDTDGITFTGTPLEGATVKTLTEASFDSGTLTLTFGNDVTSITAGTPYIIKWTTTGTDLKSPVFDNVSIDKTMHDIAVADVITFKGIHDPKAINSEDKSILYLGANNKLYYPNAAMTIKSFRAYFQLNGIKVSVLTNVRMFLGDDDEATSIQNSKIKNQNEDDAVYDLSGRKFKVQCSMFNGLPKGIYIVNGRKVLY